MADLDDLNAALTVKVAGASLTGAESYFMDVDSNGNAKTVVNNASGASAVNIQDGGNSITVDGTVAATQSGAWNITNITGTVSLPTGAATEATQLTQNTLIGAVTETVPASDTASSGLNGRLQRIAQRITSLIALLPASLGQKTMANSLAVTIASDQTAVPASQSGTWTVTAAEDKNFGTVGATTLRAAAQIGNATGAADFNAGATGAQTLRTVANQGAPNTAANGWFARITDGTDNALVTTNSDLQVTDISNNGGSAGAITVGTSAVLASVSGTNLTNRKFLSVYNNGSVPIFYGHANTVTTTSGTPIARGQFISWAVGSSTNVYLITTISSQNVRVTELA